MTRFVSATLLVVFFIALCASACPALAAGEKREPKPGASKGQLVFTPAYSHIYIGDRERPFLLTVTLAVRNTSPSESISLTNVDYYDSEGKLLKQYLSAPVEIAKLGSARFTVPESDKAGGSGASFLVGWKSSKAVSSPIVESVMVGTGGQQGVSFTSRGEAIKELE
jgi:hypothetical protein